MPKLEGQSLHFVDNFHIADLSEESFVISELIRLGHLSERLALYDVAFFVWTNDNVLAEAAHSSISLELRRLVFLFFGTLAELERL